jgi:hypothetical protein
VFKDGVLPNIGIGDLRKAIVGRAGEGMNAPYDSYLRIAYQIKMGETVDSY